MKFLAFSGSLRTASFNTAVIRTAAGLCTPPATMTIYDGLGRLPYFNHEIETTSLPAEAADFRARLEAADAVLISAPEYAHGMSGVLKNGLEWVVGGGELVDKPVGITSASSGFTGGDRAQAWLKETLLVMGARILPESLLIGSASGKITDGRVTDEETLAGLRHLLEAMGKAAQEKVEY
ncbi:MAG: NADPH-dependent FMN reductase [Streptosporangiaceae bacterium]